MDRREKLGIKRSDVEALTRRIAGHQNNPDFYVSHTTLDDIERDSVPSVHKLYALATIYRIDFTELVSWYGINFGLSAADFGLAPIPDSLFREALAGDVIGDHLILRRQVAAGSFGTVWEAFDSRKQQGCVVKLFPKRTVNSLLREYLQYLSNLIERLPAGMAGVLVPTEVAETEKYFYQVNPYLESAVSLDHLMKVEGPLQPELCFSILSQTLRALVLLHARSIVHADLKPSNVLVQRSPVLQVHVTDFGMAKIERDGSALVFATPRYMHPDLRQIVSASGVKSAGVEILVKRVGTYIDIYAAGIMALEMLIGEMTIAWPPVTRFVQAIMEERNPAVRSYPPEVLGSMSSLITRMISVSPDGGEMSASDVLKQCEELLFRLKSSTGMEATREVQATRYTGNISSHTDVSGSTMIAEFRELLTRIESVGKEISATTAAFVAQAGALSPVPNIERDEQILTEIREVFENALARSQSSWKIGLLMTIAAFGIIIAMIGTAVMLTVVTRKAAWGLVFGGVGTSAIIGTLIWRPFDRVFRATITSQQIEMIHVRTVAGFRATQDFKERMRVCNDAIASLEALFRQQFEEKPVRAMTKSRRKQRARAGNA